VFGGHIWELVIVLALALVVFGPKRLPEIGGAMGKGIREFKKGTSELSELGDSVNSNPSATARTGGATQIPDPAQTQTSETAGVSGPGADRDAS
jgi:TatA/E family protein of Tat protein translocase